jgi:hypothetical protein
MIDLGRVLEDESSLICCAGSVTGQASTSQAQIVRAKVFITASNIKLETLAKASSMKSKLVSF